MRALLPLACLVLAAGCAGGDDSSKDDTDKPVDRPQIEARVAQGVLGSGGEHTCLLVAGEARCWGHNGLGEALTEVGPFVSLSAGTQSNCAITPAGDLHCWGVAGDERLVVPTGFTFVRVDVGTSHSCATDSNGAAHCWGRDASTKLRPPTGRYLDMDSGNNQTCAVDLTGLPVCWGTTDALQDIPDGAYNLIRVGASDACALATNDALACWGGGAVTFEAPTSGTFKDVSVGDSTACAVRTDDGSITCWGGNGAGFGEEVVTNTPTGAFDAVTVGTGHACALSSAGVTCWGADSFGVTTPPAPGAVDVATATSAACAIAADGGFHCFGQHGAFDTLDGHAWRSVEMHSAEACAVNTSGDATCGIGSLRPFTFPEGSWEKVVDYGSVGFCGLSLAGEVRCYQRNGTALPTIDGTYTQIATGRDGICGLSSAGEVSCLGDAEADKPTGPFTALEMGGLACALDEDGEAHCWGTGEVGMTPAAGPFAEITVGGTFGCGRKTADNTLVCWGDDKLIISPVHSYTAIDADSGTVCGVREDGTVECFGEMRRVSLAGKIGPL